MISGCGKAQQGGFGGGQGGPGLRRDQEVAWAELAVDQVARPVAVALLAEDLAGSAEAVDGAAQWFLVGAGRFDINRPHGSVYYSASDSALDAAPYALTDSPVDKAAYMRQRFGASVGGPLNIPGI